MIGAIEIWVQHADGRQQVVRVGDDVTVRELPADVAPPGETQEPSIPLGATGRAGLNDLIDELRDDARVFETRGGTAQAAYASAMVSRLTRILEAEDAD